MVYDRDWQSGGGVEEEEHSNVAGIVALVFGIVGAVGAVLGLIAAMAGGALSGFCGFLCPLCIFTGPVASVVPLVAGLVSLIGAIWGVVVRLRGQAHAADKNKMYATIAIVLGVLSLGLDFVSVLIACWAIIAGFAGLAIVQIADLLGMHL